MIKYISKSEYYSTENGTQITKNTAKNKYKIIRKWKTVKVQDDTKGLGYEHKTIITTYINECKRNNQITLWTQ